MSEPIWRRSWRADPQGAALADRHYNRQRIGAKQFVPPGRCVVLLGQDAQSVWVTAWPFAAYVKHAWAGAWVNALFRREGGTALASEMIAAAVAATRAIWEPPPLGIVTFVDPRRVRHKRDPGRCYRKAGWTHVGYTSEEKLWVYQQTPASMPAPDYSYAEPQLVGFS